MNKGKKLNKKLSRPQIDDDLPEIEAVEDVDNPRSWAIYGSQGTGKTTLLGSFPKPILLMDFNEKGTDSVIDIKDLDVAKISNRKQLEAIYWALKRGTLRSKKSKKPYKTIGWDTVTQAQQMVIEDVSGSDEPMSFGTLSRQEWGEVSGSLKKYIVDFRDLDMETVFLCQQRIFEPRDDEVDDGNITTEVGPALQPAVAMSLNSNVNFIGQTFKRLVIKKTGEGKHKVKIKKIQYCLLVGPDDVRLSKIRKPKNVVPPEFLINPTYQDLMEAIEGEK